MYDRVYVFNCGFFFFCFTKAPVCFECYSRNYKMSYNYYIRLLVELLRVGFRFETSA